MNATRVFNTIHVCENSRFDENLYVEKNIEIEGKIINSELQERLEQMQNLIKVLQDKIEIFEERIVALEYAPGGEIYQQAKLHFENSSID